MWANAQRDGRPIEYRWRPLFNAAKYGWCPLLECRAVMLPRCKTRSNLLGCPKLRNACQPLVSQSSPYYEDVGEILLFNNFFPTVDTCLSCKDIAQQSCAMVPRWRIFGDFLDPAFPASRVQHISDLHYKSAHHVWKYRMVDKLDIQSATAEIRQGKKVRRKKQDKTRMWADA